MGKVQKRGFAYVFADTTDFVVGCFYYSYYLFWSKALTVHRADGKLVGLGGEYVSLPVHEVFDMLKEAAETGQWAQWGEHTGTGIAIHVMQKHNLVIFNTEKETDGTA